MTIGKRKSLQPNSTYFCAMQLYRCVILFLFVNLMSLKSLSQVPFSGKITEYPLPVTGVVILEYWKGEGWKKLADVPLTADGSFKQNVVFPQLGQYRIRLSTAPTKWGDFILDPKSIGTAGVSFSISYNQLAAHHISIETSREDSAYRDLMDDYYVMIEKRKQLKEDTLKRMRAEQDFFNECLRVKTAHKGTFTADIVAAMFAFPESPEWKKNRPNIDSIEVFIMKNGLKQAPLHVEVVINHFALVKTLNEFYYPFHKRKTPEPYIDAVLPRSMGNEVVNAFVFKFVLDKMMDYKSDAGVEYLITWYAMDCTENSNMTEATQKLIKALENCKPGNKISPLTLPDLTGKMISMEEIYKKNKITIIMFWRGECSHCKEFEPILEDIYARYHDKGIEIYAIGTDNEEKPWRDQATINASPWPSVFLAKNARMGFNEKYPVPSTPTLMAVDQNGIILRRLIMRSQLEEVLNELLSH